MVDGFGIAQVDNAGGPIVGARHDVDRVARVVVFA